MDIGSSVYRGRIGGSCFSAQIGYISGQILRVSLESLHREFERVYRLLERVRGRHSGFSRGQQEGFIRGKGRFDLGVVDTDRRVETVRLGTREERVGRGFEAVFDTTVLQPEGNR